MPVMTTYHGGSAPTPTQPAGSIAIFSTYPDNDGYTTPPPKTNDGYGKHTATPPKVTTTTAPPAPVPTLPVTGPDPTSLTIGGVLVLGGAALLAASRRRGPTGHVPQHAR